MKKKDSSFRESVESLREAHSDKLESIFLAEYAIVMNAESDDKDKNNAAKVCVSMLGLPRPPTMAKEPDKPTGEKEEKPTLSKTQSSALDDILGRL
jgi:hypothetical protein